MQKPPQLARGFTLIELLVTVVILAILAGLSWRGLDAVIQARQATAKEFDSIQRLSTLFAQLKRDFENLAPLSTQLPPITSSEDATLQIIRRETSTQGRHFTVVRYRLKEQTLERGISLPIKSWQEAENYVRSQTITMQWQALTQQVTKLQAIGMKENSRNLAEAARWTALPVALLQPASDPFNINAVNDDLLAVKFSLTLEQDGLKGNVERIFAVAHD